MHRLLMPAMLVLMAGCQAEMPAHAGAPIMVRPDSKQFRDWWVGCDNVNDCSAYAAASDHGMGWIRVAREAGPDGAVIIAAGFDLNEDTHANTPISLIVDGRRWPLSDGDGGCPDCALPGSDWGVYEGGDPDALARAIAHASEITVTDGRTGQALDAAGAAAALLWIDERQGRLYTATAWVRRGGRPAHAVPAAPSLPRVIAAPAVPQDGFDPKTLSVPAPIQRLADECQADWKKELGEDAPTFSRPTGARLNATTELWGVVCGEGGYYSELHDWYLTGPSGVAPRPIRLTTAYGGLEGPTINGGYDPKTRSLSMFEEGRGIADCGVMRSWTWTGESFVLATEEVAGVCAGVPWSQWMTNWRTRSS